VTGVSRRIDAYRLAESRELFYYPGIVPGEWGSAHLGPSGGCRRRRRYSRKEDPLMTPDRLSFCLGMVFAFAEVVGSGVKPLALSPPLDQDEFVALEEEVRRTASQFGLLVGEDRDVLTTLLFDPAFTARKAVFLLAADEAVLEDYASLKAARRRIGARGDEQEELDLARRFGRLLGYSSEVVEDLCRNPRFAGGVAAG